MLPSVVIPQVTDSLLNRERTAFQLRDEKLEQARFGAPSGGTGQRSLSVDSLTVSNFYEPCSS